MAGSEVFEKNKALFVPVATDYIRAIDNPAGTPLSGNVLFSDNIAGKLYSSNSTTYPVGPLTDTQYLQVSGGSIISSAVTGGGGSSDGWNAMPGTTTYVSADSPSYVVSINSNVGTLVQAGHRMKWTQGTTVSYGIVTNVGAYSSGTIPVTVYGGTAYSIGTAAIGSVYYSPVKAPYGFNTDPNYWTFSYSGTSTVGTANPTANTWYNLGGLSANIPIGCWRVRYSLLPYGYRLGAANAVQLQIALSTSNNSVSDSTLTGAEYAGLLSAPAELALSLNKARPLPLNLASKTTYYFIMRTISSNIGNISFENATETLYLICESAYL